MNNGKIGHIKVLLLEYMYSLCVCVYLYVCVLYVYICVLKGIYLCEDQTMTSGVSSALSLWVPKIKLGSSGKCNKRFHLLNHLTSPNLFISKHHPAD